jgi:hypothetical protein
MSAVDKSRYGVSRVYLQQCGYVLSDAQNMYNSMHLMLGVVEGAALDPRAGKARLATPFHCPNTSLVLIVHR